MKKYSTYFLVLAVVAIIISGNHFFTTPKLEAVEKIVAPQEETTTGIQPPVMESTSGAKMDSDSSDYFLPYPGILPNHPLYFLKDIRDRIIEMLIADPERKAEFYLLQSDKWLSAGVALIDTKDLTTAKKTLSDSSNRMVMAVSQLTTIKTNGGQLSAGTVDKFSQSIQKHQQVMSTITAIDTKDMLQQLDTAETELGKIK